MIEVHKGLFVGTVEELSGWEGTYIAAAKEPCHRKALGYTGRGAPKDHPEYLVAIRGRGMILNLVDGNDPAWIDKGMIEQALNHITIDPPTLIVCNQGRSRSPTIALLYMLKSGLLLADSFDIVEEKFKKICSYDPAPGMREFARQYFKDLQ